MTSAKYQARRATSTKPRTSRPAAIAVAKLRKLAAALERDDLPAGIPEEIQALSEQLADLGDRRRAAAAAVLAHTRRGSPVARGYLAVLASEADPASVAAATADPGELAASGDGAVAALAAVTDAADAVARYCATMQRGRKALRPAFLATWRRAGDIAAVEAAWKNLARIAIDDPALLAIAVETARRLGNASALADHTARLDRALRLVPLLGALAGGAGPRGRATQQLAALDAADRRHIYARVVDHPRGYDKALAIAAVIALVDDPRAPDMALAAAVFELPRAAKDQLVAAWQPRVIAGDTTLIVRLLALFEWTGLWATDPEPFEPFVRALIPAGRQADVFAQVESGLASDKLAVREAILLRWLADPAGLAAFSDGQADNLMRSAIAIAEGGTATGEQRAAHRVVSYAGDGRTGVHRALIDGVRHASARKAGELRGNLYRGLSRIEHPEVVAFLVEQLFAERTAYSAMMAALAARIDADVHRVVLDALAHRRADPGAIHAAAVYADTLIEQRPSARLLGDLGRAVLTWQPVTADDKRRLRYVFEQATLAAIAIQQPRDARAFLARARSLDVVPYSDYQVVDRDRKTPAAFADPAGKKLIAALEVGAIDKAIAVARETADAARAAGTPIAADDAQLGALAGCTVAARWLDDRAHHEVWFFDELGDLHVYDGYDIVLPSFQVTGGAGRGIAPDGMTGFLAGAARIDERVLLYATAKHDRARELIRLGHRVLVLDGLGRDKTGELAVTTIGLRFADPIAARAAVAAFAAHPPAGLQRVDPFHVAGLGAVRRSYRISATGTPAHNVQLALTDDRATGTVTILGAAEFAGTGAPPLAPSHPTRAAAVTAVELWETRVLVGGGRTTAIAIDRAATTREKPRAATR